MEANSVNSRRAQKLFAYLHDQVTLVDAQGRIVYTSVSLNNALGYTAEEHIGLQLLKLVHPDDRAMARDFLAEVLAAPEVTKSAEGRARHKDGHYVWVELIVTNKLNDPDVAAIVVASRDISARKQHEAEISNLNRILTVHSESNQAIIRIREPQALFEQICRIAVEKGGFRSAWLGLVDPETQILSIAAQAGMSDADRAVLDEIIDSFHAAGRRASSLTRGRAHIILNDVESQLDEPGAAVWLRLNARALAAFPLTMNGEFRGLLTLSSGEPNVFNEAEVRLLDEMAQDVSFALEVAEKERARLLAETANERYLRRMEIIHAIDRGIVAATSTEELIAGVLKHLRTLIACQIVTLDTVDWVANKVSVFAADHDGPPVLGQAAEIEIDPGWLGGFGTGKHQLIDDLQRLPNPSRTYRQLTRAGMRSCLHILLQANNIPLGSLNLLASAPGFFTPEHLEIASEVADQLTVAIQQQRLNEALRQSEVRYRQVVEHQVDPVCRYRPDLTITFANRAYADIMSTSVDELVGTSLLNLVPEASWERTRAHVAAINAANPFVSFETQLPPLTRTHWYQWQDRAVLDADGKVVEIQGVGRDITARRQAEQAEREQRRMAEALRDSLAALSSSLDVDEVLRLILDYAATVVPSDAGSIILFEGANERIALLRGFSPEVTRQYLNLSLSRAATPPDSVIDRRSPFIIDDTRTASDWITFKETDWIRSSIGVPIEAHGAIVGLLSADSAAPNHFTTADLDKLQAFARYAGLALQNAYSAQQLEARVAARTAELNDAKDRVEAILNSSLDGILLVALDLSIQRVNPAFARLTNCVSTDCIGHSLTNLIVEDDWSRVSAAIQSSLLRRVGQQIDARIRRFDGTSFDAELSISSIDTQSHMVDAFVCTVRDVTERKQAQAKLAEERNLLRTLIDTLPDFIWIKDRQHRFVMRNAARGHIMSAILPADVTGKTDSDIFPSAVAAQYLADEAAIFTTGVPLINHPEAVTDAEGNVHWVSSTKVPLYSLSGELIGLVGANRDITESRRQEQELRYHASLQENVSDAVISADLKYSIQSWNRAAERIFGWRAEEAIGQSFVDILKIVYTSEEQRRAYIDEFNRTGRWQGEIGLHRRDGSRLDVLAAVTLFKDNENTPLGIVAILHDITARKQAEQQLRHQASVLAAISDAVISTDIDFRIQSWNKAAEHIYGWQAEEVIGQRLHSVLRSEFTSPEEQAAAERQIYAERRWHSELVEYRKDGSRINILGTMAPLYDSEGAIIGSVLANHDITARKTIERELSARHEQEREFQQYLKELHEITIELTPVDQLEDFYRRVVELGRDRLGFDRLALFLYGPSDGCAVGTYGTDIQGATTDESACRFIPGGLMQQAFRQAERFAFEEDAPLTTNLRPDGTGWNAASALWDGNEKQGWLVADNGIHHRPATKALLDILALYSLAVGTLLARKRTNDALQQSEASLRAVMTSTSVGFLLVAQDGTIRLGNQLALDYGQLLYQQTLEMGKTSLFDLNLNDREGVRFILEQVFAGKPMHVELVQQIGTLQYAIDLRYDPVIQSDGSVIGATVSFIDVTERKQAEIALRESEKKFRSLVEDAPEAIVISDELGQITLVNAQAERVFQYTRDELIGQKVEILVPDMYREQHEQLRAGFLNMPSRLHDRDILGLMGRRKDGTTFYVDIQLSYVTTRDGSLVLSFIEDVTDRKQAEEALRQSEELLRDVLENLPVGVWLIAPDGKIVFGNPAGKEIWGGAKYIGIDSFAVYRGWWLESGKQIEPDEWAAARAIVKGETSLNEEIEIEAFDGTHKYLLNSAIPIRDSEQRIQGAIIVNQDVTMLKLAENTLRAAFEKEKELGDLKSRFVSMASHEFRTPLATILSSSEMLLNYRERMDEPKIDRKLITIANQVKHLTSIVEDVLDLTRMQSGRTEFRPVAADLDALCREIVDEFRSRAEIQQTITYTCAQASVQFPFDRKLMRQIVINLVANACKYSAPEKSVYIGLEFTETNAILRVRDEGIGIPEADMRHLFEPFHRAGNVGTVSGTGLGLSIAKQAIELHEGTIRAESRVNVGSTFTVTLPIKSLAEHRSAVNRSSRPN